MPTVLDQIAIRIVREQELVIGPLAWAEAGKVAGIHIIDARQGTLTLETSDGKSVIDKLVSQYERLFGRASIEVCREAARSFIKDLAPGDVPASLK